MKGFFGVIGKDPAQLQGIVQQFEVSSTQKSRTMKEPRCFISDYSPNQDALIMSKFPDYHLAAWVRLDNRDELLPLLGLGEAVSDEVVLLAAYDAYGEDCVKHLIGDFSFAIWDRKRQQIFLAKDQAGIRPLFYLQVGESIIFSTFIPSIKSAVDGKLPLNLPYLAKHLKNYPPEVGETFFKDIMRLKPAHYMLTDGALLEEKKYWELKPLELPRFKNREDYYALVRRHLEEAVRCRIRGKQRVGAQLSGGMDSSVITVLLSKMMDKRQLHTFSFVLDEQSKVHSKTKTDEQETQQEIIRYAALVPENHHHITRFHYRDIQEELQTRNLVMGGWEDGDSFWQDSLFKLAGEKQGVELMFSGFPGDEGVSEFGHHFFYEYLGNKNMWGILQYLFEFRVGGLRNIFRYFQYKRQGTGYPAYQKIQQERDLLHPESPFHQMLQDDSFPFYPTYREFLKNHALRYHTAQRAESEGSYAIRYSIETVYPLADIRLIQLLYSLPVELFKPKPFSRALFRNVCKGLLPDRVRLQYKYNYAYTLAFYDDYSHKKIEALRDYRIKNHTGLMIDAEVFRNKPHVHGEDKEERLAFMKELDFIIGLNWPSHGTQKDF
ncbi:asparagine synthetase B family protein [Cecembia lonarensis]|uniref:asparagine synthase (glutamine-hydrolyzing) n=1 Tax=Cecembia lonarensis (strain CCUG 58316 / KCTC 22772 / LW9) TaxID=1225176 RepID=K1LTC5_CECL9|nr:asparagine synthase-related protein [Cecembia lonarensis]EKB47409.1 asparagine synthase [Cecembia lonarensis LW9]